MDPPTAEEQEAIEIRNLKEKILKKLDVCCEYLDDPDFHPGIRKAIDEMQYFVTLAFDNRIRDNKTIAGLIAECTQLAKLRLDILSCRTYEDFQKLQRREHDRVVNETISYLDSDRQ